MIHIANIAGTPMVHASMCTLAHGNCMRVPLSTSVLTSIPSILQGSGSCMLRSQDGLSPCVCAVGTAHVAASPHRTC